MYDDDLYCLPSTLNFEVRHSKIIIVSTPVFAFDVSFPNEMPLWLDCWLSRLCMHTCVWYNKVQQSSHLDADTQTQADRQTGRQTDRLTDWQTDRQAFTHARTLAQTHAHKHTHTHAHTHTCTHTHAHTHTHIHTHTHTHVHTLTRSLPHILSVPPSRPPPLHSLSLSLSLSLVFAKKNVKRMKCTLGNPKHWLSFGDYIPRVPNQNGVSQAWYIVEIYHSGWKSLICCLTILNMPLWRKWSGIDGPAWTIFWHAAISK